MVEDAKKNEFKKAVWMPSDISKLKLLENVGWTDNALRHMNRLTAIKGNIVKVNC